MILSWTIGLAVRQRLCRPMVVDVRWVDGPPVLLVTASDHARLPRLLPEQ